MNPRFKTRNKTLHARNSDRTAYMKLSVVLGGGGCSGATVLTISTRRNEQAKNSLDHEWHRGTRKQVWWRVRGDVIITTVTKRILLRGKRLRKFLADDVVLSKRELFEYI